MAHTRRVQLLMEPEEYDGLARIADSRGVSVAEVIRSAIRSTCSPSKADRIAAVERIAAIGLPVDDWSRMKAELEEAYDGGVP